MLFVLVDKIMIRKRVKNQLLIIMYNLNCDNYNITKDIDEDLDDFKDRIEDLQDSYRTLENDVDDLIEDIKGAIKNNEDPDVLSELKVLLDDAKDILY